MNRPLPRRTRVASMLSAFGILTLVALTAALVTASPTPALPDYVHGGISPVACEICHTDNHTNWPVASEKCLTCHTDYDAPDLPITCWTCHTPGQDMADERSEAACTTECHLPGGTTSRHQAHAGGGAACTTCHPVSPTISDPGSDPHHVLPVPAAPTVAGFTPSTGAPGTSVTVTGTGFAKAIAVTFGGVRASTFVASSDTQLTTMVPAGAISGPVAVTNAGGTGTSPTAFVVPGRITASLTVTVSPAILKRGARVTVTGAVKPAALGGSLVGITVQERSGSRWLRAKVLSVRTAGDGSFTWRWLPPKKALYRLRTTLEATARHTGAHSAWVGFRVR